MYSWKYTNCNNINNNKKKWRSWRILKAKQQQYEDLDGNTAQTTIAVDIASSLGVLCVNSAGNSGNNSGNFRHDISKTTLSVTSTFGDSISNYVNEKYLGDSIYFYFETPNYKVRIGKYKSKIEAEKKLKEIKKEFKSAFVFKPSK